MLRTEAEQSAAAEQAGHNFYTSVMDGPRGRPLSGPFKSHAEALADVERVRALANEQDCRAAFYGFGTCSSLDLMPVLFPVRA